MFALDPEQQLLAFYYSGHAVVVAGGVTRGATGVGEGGLHMGHVKEFCLFS